jgi:hypothetical protein
MAGCTPEQHEGAAAKAESAKAVIDGFREAIGSDVAKAVAGAVAAIPVPVTQAVPVARDRVEWGLGIASGLLALFAGWQTKRAAEERSKKKTYKANSTQAELDAANKVIYGDDFDPKKSKF